MTLCASSRNSKWMSFFFLSPHFSITVMNEPLSELAGGGLPPGSSPKWKRQTPLQEDQSCSWQVPQETGCRMELLVRLCPSMNVRIDIQKNIKDNSFDRREG